MPALVLLLIGVGLYTALANECSKKAGKSFEIYASSGVCWSENEGYMLLEGLFVGVLLGASVGSLCYALLQLLGRATGCIVSERPGVTLPQATSVPPEASLMDRKVATDGGPAAV